jgi:hypothetical protein
MKQAWGAFGWLEIQWPNNVYRVLTLLTAAVGLGALIALVRRRRRLNLTLLAFFAIAFVSLLAGLHWNEFKLMKEGGALVNQGRYLFPLVGLAGLAAAAALTAVPPRWRGPLLGAGLAALGVLELLSIGLVASRFYA